MRRFGIALLLLALAVTAAPKAKTTLKCATVAPDGSTWVNLLRKMIPRGVWLHDRQDGNGDSHLKAGLVGPSETIPIIDGLLGLSRWQNVFFCEFDGPRAERRVVCTVIAD